MSNKPGGVIITPISIKFIHDSSDNQEDFFDSEFIIDEHYVAFWLTDYNFKCVINIGEYEEVISYGSKGIEFFQSMLRDLPWWATKYIQFNMFKEYWIKHDDNSALLYCFD